MENVFSAFSAHTTEEEFPLMPVEETPIPEDADFTQYKFMLFFYLKPEILWEHISSVKPNYGCRHW
jgi:hypothetical protein